MQRVRFLAVTGSRSARRGRGPSRGVRGPGRSPPAGVRSPGALRSAVDLDVRPAWSAILRGSAGATGGTEQPAGARRQRAPGSGCRPLWCRARCRRRSPDGRSGYRLGGRPAVSAGENGLPHLHRPARRGDRAGEDLDQRRLAGPVGADQANDLAGGDVERNLAEDIARAILLCQLRDPQRRRSTRCRSAPLPTSLRSLTRRRQPAMGWGRCRACSVPERPRSAG